ncbi:coiled-coil domain-containing protein 1 [Drosophila gunungcola]|uniref:Uncharacterized protein n=1 Tax=Drosophila gunungcola TaxID=103775 RepID=A0A9P9YHA7_9MUSC|nr:coiled-coil domain-containing protein 1 [Drosophila gunungcola]KAI8036735.1 hypothetical protein M5D96_010536 [Drosophila gunungcola]
MQSNKVSFLFFVLAIVIAVSLSSEVSQGDDVISDRRFRWEFSQDSDESANDLQEDDSEDDSQDDSEDNDDQDNSDQDNSGNDSGEYETWEVVEITPDSNESEESASNEA